MWKRLAAQHEQTAEEFQYHLLQSFFDYKYQKSHNVMDHITAIETLAAQLADIGSPRSEQDFITKIICTLSPSLRPVRSAWKNVAPSKRTLQLLTTRLLEEESYNREYEGAPSDTAFFANQNGGTSSQAAKARRRDVTCDFCGRQGHTEENCWQKAKQMSGTQAKFAHSVKLQPPPYSQPEVQTWSTDYAFRCSLSNHSGPRDANWLVDSDASQHMSDQR